MMGHACQGLHTRAAYLGLGDGCSLNNLAASSKLPGLWGSSPGAF